MDSPLFPPDAVLGQYPIGFHSEAWTPLPAQNSGYSGSRVWFEDKAGLVLKAVPASGIAETDLMRNHQWIESARQTGIETLPSILQTTRGKTVVLHANRYWIMMTKRPGQAGFWQDGNDRRLRAIVEELARLHRFWNHRFGFSGSIPGVMRRLARLDEGQTLFERPFREAVESHVASRLPAWEEIRQLNGLLPIRLVEARQELEPLRHLRVPVHPCLCDCWHDHFLFEADRLTGIIDFDAVKIDHPAVDLARALGSLLPRDRERWRQAFAWYRVVQPTAPFPFEWIELLHETGQVVAALHWLRKLVLETDRNLDHAKILPRVVGIIESLQEQPSSPDTLPIRHGLP